LGFLKDIASIAGEAVRMHRTEKQANNIDPQTKQMVDNARKDAENGSVKAMVWLANAYYYGKVVGYDPELMRYWMTKAAERGNVNSQYNLGLLYKGDMDTKYISVDFAKAGYWLSIAARNGDKEAERILRESFAYNKRTEKWYEKY